MLFVPMLSFGQKKSDTTNQKSKLDGKYFEVKIGDGACAELAGGGGCMEYDYFSFTFKKDSVKVSRFMRANCKTPGEDYSYETSTISKPAYFWYTIKNNMIIVENPKRNTFYIINDKIYFTTSPNF